jgi:hypothetical protein
MGDMVVIDQIEDLGLVYVTRVGKGVENPVGIQGKVKPMPPFHALLGLPVNSGGTGRGMGGKDARFSAVEILFELQQGRWSFYHGRTHH